MRTEDRGRLLGIIVLLVLNVMMLAVVIGHVNALRAAVEQADDARARAEDLRAAQEFVQREKDRATLMASVGSLRPCRPGWYEGMRQPTEDRARGAAAAVAH